MSYKETCPGCGTHSSSVASARFSGDPCPQCGLSADASTEIMTVQQGRADDAVKSEFAELRLRADRAERDSAVLGEVLGKIHEALSEWEQFTERRAGDEFRGR